MLWATLFLVITASALSRGQATVSECILSIQVSTTNDVPAVQCENTCSPSSGIWFSTMAYKRLAELEQYGVMVEVHYEDGAVAGCSLVPYKTPDELLAESAALKTAIDICTQDFEPSAFPPTTIPPTFRPTTYRPTTYPPTTFRPTTYPPTTYPTYPPTTFRPTTYPPTTYPTYPPTTIRPTTYPPTTYLTYPPTTFRPTTYPPTTYPPTTFRPTTYPPTTYPTYPPTTLRPTTVPPTFRPTTYPPTTTPPTSFLPTTPPPTTPRTTTPPTTTPPTTTPPTTTPPPVYRCPDGFTTVGGSCYSVTINSDTRANSAAQCEKMGGYLSTIDSSQEQQQLSSILKNNVWIGQNDIAAEGSFQPATFTNWNNGEPNNHNGNEDCTVMYASNAFKWNDLDCNAKVNALCEADPIPVEYVPQCREGEVLFEGSCYFLTGADGDYDAGARSCRIKGGYPVFVNSQAEQNFIAGSSALAGQNYIGYTDRATEGRFVSDDVQSLMMYTSWGANEPNDHNDGEDCVEVRGDRLWNDIPCTQNRKMICERSANPDTRCPIPFIGYYRNGNSACYLSPDATGTFQEARDYCATIGAHLANIDSQQEQDFAASLVKGDTYIGLTRVNKNTMQDFARLDGAPMLYHGWASGEPNDSGNNEGCVELRQVVNYKWNDSNCGIKKLFLCEI